jgi:enamine deaminase RidA (YjgF/YER057c/UK114 family)
MERELSNPPGVHTPHAHYSHVARAGNTLYVAGQLPQFLVEIEGIAVLD